MNDDDFYGKTILLSEMVYHNDNTPEENAQWDEVGRIFGKCHDEAMK